MPNSGFKKLGFECLIEQAFCAFGFSPKGIVRVQIPNFLKLEGH